MRSNQLVWMGAAVLAVSTFGMGCSGRKADVKTGSVDVTANALSYTDIDHVTVVVSGSGPTATVPMGKKNGSLDWKAMVSGITAGPVTVTANAYKAGVVQPVFSGQINSTITVGGTAVINLTMYEIGASKFMNSAPVISAIQVSSKTVEPLASISVGAVATDPDGDPLTYAWTSSCGGTFSAATAASGTFTAPATAGNCTLTVKVSDNHQANNTATVQINVLGATKGNANITATPDLAPTVAFVGINVKDSTGADAPFVAGNLAHLVVSASDDNTATALLTYAWQADCAGTFDNNAAVAPVFTLSATTGSCTFTVTVTDQPVVTGQAGSSNMATLTIPVQAAGSNNNQQAPTIELFSQSSDKAYAGDTLFFYITSSIQAGHGWGISWASSVGTGTQTDSNGFLSSQLAWTTPTGLTDGQDLTFTATVTDYTNSLIATQVFHVTAASAQCAADPDGTPCTGSNQCNTVYSCQGHTCVGSAPVDCSQNLAICKTAGTCNPSNGQCVYPDAALGVSCNDGNLCTTSDTCNGAGSCIAGPTTQCPAATMCHVAGACVPSTGQCSAETPAPVGTTCNDGNLCNLTDACDANGACVGTGTVTCPAATDSCHVAGVCVPATGCSPQTIAPDTTPCNDNSLCTSNDVCTNGVCGGTAVCVAPMTCNPVDGSCVAPACMPPQYATSAAVSSAVGLATDVNGNIFVSGTMYGLGSAPIAFGGVNIGAGAGANVYAARINPTTRATVWATAWGDDSDQVGVAMAASQNNVAMIGNYIGVLGSGLTGITPIPGLPANTGSLPVDFVVGLDAASGTPVWSKKIDLGGAGMASIYSNPNLSAYYLCGSATIAVADLGLTTTNTDGKNDIIVAKINAADGAVVWARQIGGAGIQVCSSIVADGQNVYLTGTYQGTLDFGNGTGAFASIANVARKILWAAKLSDTDGSSLVAKAWGTLGAQLIRSITLDKDGNVLIAGAMASSTIPFGGTVGDIVATSTDALIVKLDSSLTPMWAHNWGDSATQDLRAVATDSDGNVYAAGLLNGAITAGGTTLTASGADILSMKLDSAGNVLCIKQFGDTGGDQGDNLVVNRFASTASGQKDKLVMRGLYAGNVPFGSTTLTTPSLGTKYGFVVGSDR